MRKRQERSSINEGLLADQPTRKDALGYYRLAQSVAKHIISLRADETPLTIGVYGPWGSGKTSFLSMVTEHLEISGAAPIWFHAWRYDQEEHLWAALLQTVLTKAPIDGGLWRRAAVRLGIWKDTINFGRGLLLNLKIFGPILRIVFVMLVIAFAMVWKTPIESAISVLPKGIEFSPFWTKLTLGVLAFIAARPDQLLKLFDTRLGLDLNAFRRNRTFREHIAFLDEFQDEFQRITKRISPARPLVIIIDDLDRCLPEKAIGVLEAVKQFLDVPNSVRRSKVSKRSSTTPRPCRQPARAGGPAPLQSPLWLNSNAVLYRPFDLTQCASLPVEEHYTPLHALTVHNHTIP